MDNGTAAIVIAVGTVICTLVAKFAESAISWSNSKNTTQQKIRQDTLGEYKDLLDRQEKRLAQLETEVDMLNRSHRECEKQHVRAVTWIEALEEALRKANVSFRPWTTASDTGVHAPLPTVPESKS